MPRSSDPPASELFSTGAPPRVVAFGGGTGMSCLLSGLKSYPVDLTAIVTVTDNGGSSGRLRKEFDMVPPGDIRNCLLALADAEPLLARLLDYRFEESELRGHSFGNLFITALTRVTGSFDGAIRELNRLLEVRGRVLPATGKKVTLIAHHPGGAKSTGEVQITNAALPIERVEMRPRVSSIAADVAQAIQDADVMLFGPGSLFTSVIPNLLVKGILTAVRANSCPKVYVSNIMTQPGETVGMSLRDHVEALERHAGEAFISGVVVHQGVIDPKLLERYSRDGAEPVLGAGSEDFPGRDLELAAGDLVCAGAGPIRHCPEKLGRLIHETFLCGLITDDPHKIES